MRESFRRELGSELRVQATQFGKWIHLHNPQIGGEWVHEQDLSPRVSWRDRVHEMVRVYVLKDKPE